MLIGVKKRFVFVANSKTASTSIETVLAPHAEIQRGGDPSRKHIPLSAVRKEYHFLFGQPDYPFDSFFRFGVIRDPIEWIQSWYRYRRGNQVQAPLPSDMTFDDFWEQNDWNITTADGQPFDQSRRFLDEDDRVLADLIIPHGRLDHFIPQILNAFGVSSRLPKSNVSTIRTLETPLSDEIRAKIKAHYARDYALIGRLYDINTAGLEKLHKVAGHR